VPRAERVRVFRFESPVTSAFVHPRDDSLVLANPLLAVPVLLDVRQPEGAEGERRTLPLGSGDQPVQPKNRGQDLGVVGVFARKGTRILAGTPQGTVLVLDTASLATISTIKLSSGSGCAVKSIVFSRAGDGFLVNSTDKILRLYKCGSLGSRATSCFFVLLLGCLLLWRPHILLTRVWLWAAQSRRK
jgi:hypothetical protein